MVDSVARWVLGFKTGGFLGFKAGGFLGDALVVVEWCVKAWVFVVGLVFVVEFGVVCCGFRFGVGLV